ncbi:hypothetical protein PV327_010772 [Microctonus hyperodae]|uniref:Brinker DNA-binding domain-containing protein n=1 Tax=Microctonus hyperodae TaxID=165561 RepID=A0AA39C8R4_MICHY|nr:hypothetical protein PV327_010772 [Microctonus hyperodae]
MAHGVVDVIGEDNVSVKIVNKQQSIQTNNHQQQQQRKSVGVMGSRRIFAAAFKLKVLDSYRNDIDCRGNQRATARKYGIHRRQIQKWLQCEDNLRSSCAENGAIINNSTITTAPGNITAGIISNKSTDSTIITCITSTILSPTPATPQTPALNLSLARLHGDELVGRQGPPLPPPPSQASSRHPVHPPAGSPIANQTYQQGINPVPVHTLLVGYNEFTNQDSQHHQLHQHPDDKVEQKYYTHNDSGYDQTASYHVTNNDIGVYQQPPVPLLTYQSSTTGYNSIVNDCHSVGTSLHQTGHVSSCRNLSKDSSPVIKSERASPDSPATPGSCSDTPSSPTNAVTTITTTTTTTIASNNITLPSYQSHHHDITANDTVVVNFEPNACSTILDSKILSHEIQSSEVLSQLNNNNTVIQKIKLEPELSIPEEEIFQTHEEINESEERDCSSNYQYSERSLNSISPRGISSSSGQSSTSCSDSETDPLDFSSVIPVNPVGDLSRRRSFSLRFKLDVLDAFHRDIAVAGNQRATARKFGINRRQVQKWLGQESELRGEIILRGGDMRQRLGPFQETTFIELPVDLTTNNLDSDQSSALSPIYFCDSSTQQLGNYYTPIGMDITDISQSRTCNLSCCADNSSVTTSPINSRTCYSDSQSNYYCYSERDSIETVHDRRDLPLLKRSYGEMSCCYESLPSPKRIYIEDEPQEMPLCLVIPKQLKVPIQSEPVTSTVPTPPAIVAPLPKKDAILFKPYLDNPISKPNDDSISSNNYPIANNIKNNIINNNNNCNSICNLNEEREKHQDYAVDISLRLPVSWRTSTHHHHHHHRVIGGFSEFSDGIRSAFDRYQTSSHYI